MLATVESVLAKSWYLTDPAADSGLVSDSSDAGPIDFASRARPAPLALRVGNALNLVVRQGDMFFADARGRSCAGSIWRPTTGPPNRRSIATSR